MQLQGNGIYFIFVAFVLGIFLTYCMVDRESYDTSTLKLVHLIFRHGERYSSIHSLYPSYPYYDQKYYPAGYGQLTNAGKLTEYKLGAAFRRRYNKFLGTTWNINILEARSTAYNRTKMSLQLVLAGLYPPRGTQVWSGLPWQPIPYNYVPGYQDKELLAFEVCPNYHQKFRDAENSLEISGSLERYNKTFEILAKHTKGKIDIRNAFYLLLGFATQKELGFPLEEWSKAVYPDPMSSLSVDYYKLMTNTTTLRRIVIGYLIKRILSDTEAKIAGTLSPPERKMFLYSAHEMNIATILLSLDAFNLDHVPPYGSYIAFEVHDIEGVYGIKASKSAMCDKKETNNLEENLFYQNYKQKEPIALKIPGCNYFCPYEKFYRLVENILPKSDEDCYGSS